MDSATEGTLGLGRLTITPRSHPEGSFVRSTIVFDGASGKIDFQMQGLTELFRAAQNDIQVFTPNTGFFGPPQVQIADLQLGGRAYSADEFSVQGTALVFHHEG
jgi:hypothetical protein